MAAWADLRCIRQAKYGVHLRDPTRDQRQQLSNLARYLVALEVTEPVDAFRTACSWLSLVFLLGLVALFFLPETKDRPLPED